jgi:hypothetical protein
VGAVFSAVVKVSPPSVEYAAWAWFCQTTTTCVATSPADFPQAGARAARLGF